MRAVVAAPSERAGFAFREVDDPVPAPDQVLVEVHAFSLNLGELRRMRWERDGWRPGYDVAGIVRTPAADGSGPPAGTRVVGLLRHGAWAELAAVPARVCAPIPDGVDFLKAAAVPVAGLSSLCALAHAETLLGRRVLVTGATGGVGRFAVQLAARGGAHVTACVSRLERGVGLTEIGAAEVVVGLDAQPPDALFDLVIESVGGALLGAALERVAPRGVVVAIGGSSDQATTFDPLTFIRRGGAQLYGLQLFDDLERLGYGARELRDLLVLVRDGALDPQISEARPWDEIGESLTAMSERRLVGKAVLRVR
jgi:NADPH2:quinone reductase